MQVNCTKLNYIVPIFYIKALISGIKIILAAKIIAQAAKPEYKA